MSRIDDAARLSRHRKAAEDEVNLTPGPYYPIHMNYQVEIGMNDRWLLAVAGKFRKGDANLWTDLEEYIDFLIPSGLEAVEEGDEEFDVIPDDQKLLIRAKDCLRRMAEAAAIMEAEG